jgi:transcriptional regulator with XRE-family HTH domain
MNWKFTVTQLRHSLCLDQAEFAARIGVSQASVSRWERGVDAPGKRARERLLDLTKKEGGVLQDSSVMLQTRFNPFPAHVIDSKGRMLEMSEACATDFGVSRAELASRDTIMGAFGEMADELIATLLWRSDLFSSGVVGIECETIIDRPIGDGFEQSGITLWLSPLILSDGQIFAKVTHQNCPTREIDIPGHTRTYHVDQICT